MLIIPIRTNVTTPLNDQNVANKAIMVNTIVVNSRYSNGSASQEYTKATQLVEVVPKTQEEELQRDKVNELLNQSWANMTDEVSNED